MSTQTTTETTHNERRFKRGVSHALLSKVARSPHLTETFMSYGLSILLCTVTSFWFYQMTFSEFVGLICLGTSVYTFMEYWFHRYLLHEVLSGAHDNHHHAPRNLRLIATPIVPVLTVGFLSVFFLIKIYGHKVAYGISCGIALGQITMDVTHVLFHTSFRPWYLESARSYHMHHHFIHDEVAHGLTTSFWDMVFGTLPDGWNYFRRNSFFRYLQLPFPLLTFILIGLLAGDTSKEMVSNTQLDESSNKKRHQGFARVSWSSMAWSVGLTLFYMSIWQATSSPSQV